MESLQIHSRSYIVRWVHVNEAHSITWSVQPHKKSINFGIFKHPGTTKNGLTPALSTSGTVDAPPAAGAPPAADDDGKKRRGSITKYDGTTVMDKLQSIGLKCVEWTGNCEADKVSMGTYDVPEGAGGMYGLVFDNTFSKTVSKTATFVLMTHPTNAPPKSKAQLHYSQALSADASAHGAKPAAASTLRPHAPSIDSLSKEPGICTTVEGGSLRARRSTVSRKTLDTDKIHAGILWKKRRKRGQGYARRFFSLDLTSSTLSYYKDRHSSALRGAVPLSLAAIGADEKTREFSVDSGAEVWHLKAGNKREFDGWRDALEKASSMTIATPGPATPAVLFTRSPFAPSQDPVGEREWERVEELVGRISGTRDAVRRLAQDTDVRSGPSTGPIGPNGSAAASPSSIESSSNPFFLDPDEHTSERLPFWKRKASNGTSPRPSGLFRRKTSAQQLAVPSNPSSAPLSPAPGALNTPKRRPQTPQASQLPTEDVHERCMALLRDLDAAVTDFSALLAESKSRRLPPPVHASASRLSIDSISSQEFFDAEEATAQTSQLLLDIRRSSDGSETMEDEFQDIVSEAGDSESSSEAGDLNRAVSVSAPDSSSAGSSLFPARPLALSSLATPKIEYRATIPPPKQPPPSLIGFLRKNAGKDLSTVSMPVSANEPLSALQRLAEAFESSDLLNAAASPALSSPDSSEERLMYVAAFAVTNFASNRVKERAIRKPFNPMLGETFELVRADLGFRFVSEKVCHRPVRMAYQADALDGSWSLAQSPQAIQKFWGKSAELNTEGKMRLVLHSVGNGERYSWALATCFLRNIIAGEKYIEPVASMTVINETTGMKAIATFKAAGMFSGRSEDVSIALYSASSNTPLPLAMAGKWTTSLSRNDNSSVIWTAGPLVPDAPKVYGFTSFAAALNQLTNAEKQLLSPTDSRLRPDQRALEDGRLDEAEALKARLEERQRGRRKVLESHGAQWQPQFFEIVEGVGEEGEEIWRLKTGKDGYWEARESGTWDGISRVFET
ncbi:hypothetical protein MBLNU459_g0642t1 [Dothideomycetes sp. NU459]